MLVERFDNKNAHIITRDDGARILQSYQTPVAAIIDGKPYRTEVKHSKTTSAQTSAFFNRYADEINDGATVTYMPQGWFYGLSTLV